MAVMAACARSRGGVAAESHKVERSTLAPLPDGADQSPAARGAGIDDVPLRSWRGPEGEASNHGDAQPHWTQTRR